MPFMWLFLLFFSVLGYLKLMLMISTDAFVSSFLIAFHNRRTTSGHPPFLLTRFLTIPAMTRLLVLPKLEYTQADLEDYNRVVNDDGSERVRSTVTLWDVVVVAFERLMFIVYFVITVVVLSSVGIFAKSWWSNLVVQRTYRLEYALFCVQLVNV